VAAVGAHMPSAREVDSETISRASNRVIDSRTDCLDYAGDLMIPIAEAVIKRDDVAEIVEVVNGARPSRRSDQEITFYKSIGAPIQDLITAQNIVRRAAQAGIGAEIEIGATTVNSFSARPSARREGQIFVSIDLRRRGGVFMLKAGATCANVLSSRACRRCCSRCPAHWG